MRLKARQFQVLVSGFPEPWQTGTGPEWTRNFTEEYDGGGDVPYLADEQRKYSDITVERLYDAQRDAPRAARLMRNENEGSHFHTLTIFPLDGDGVPIRSGKLTATGKIKSVKTPDVDRNSSAFGKFRITFQIVSVK